MKLEGLQLGKTAEQLKAIGVVIFRHHLIITFVAIIGLIIYALLTVNQILSTPTDEIYKSERAAQSIRTQFDKTTIERIEGLKDRQQNSSLNLPSGRVSPFIE